MLLYRVPEICFLSSVMTILSNEPLRLSQCSEYCRTSVGGRANVFLVRLILNRLLRAGGHVSIDAETIARRYAVRPGCRLVGCQAIGIAVFSMNIRALALEPRQIPPIDEFLLRFM